VAAFAVFSTFTPVFVSVAGAFPFAGCAVFTFAIHTAVALSVDRLAGTLTLASATMAAFAVFSALTITFVVTFTLTVFAIFVSCTMLALTVFTTCAVAALTATLGTMIGYRNLRQ
jgi:hypothetical protein